MSENQIYKDPMRSYEDLITGSAAYNVAHGASLFSNTDDASTEHFRKSSKQPEWRILENLDTYHYAISIEKSRPHYQKYSASDLGIFRH